MNPFPEYCESFVQKRLQDLEFTDISENEFQTIHSEESQIKLKKQYHQLAKKYHPDKVCRNDTLRNDTLRNDTLDSQNGSNDHSPEADKFKRMKEAYEVLSMDPAGLMEKIMEEFIETQIKQRFETQKSLLKEYITFFRINERAVRELCPDTTFTAMIYLITLRDAFTDENDALHHSLLQTCKKVELRFKESLYKILETEYFTRPTYTRKQYLNSRFNTNKHEFQELHAQLQQLEIVLCNQIELCFISLDLARFIGLAEKVCDIEYKLYNNFLTREYLVEIQDELDELRESFFTPEALLKLQIQKS